MASLFYGYGPAVATSTVDLGRGAIRIWTSPD